MYPYFRFGFVASTFRVEKRYGWKNCTSTKLAWKARRAT
ncbi:hypothetical protein EV128_13926 [Rhizobium azibense]|nr:hypothetical protein EV128_13926 [Rhizobium azibense]